MFHTVVGTVSVTLVASYGMNGSYWLRGSEHVDRDRAELRQRDKWHFYVLFDAVALLKGISF